MKNLLLFSAFSLLIFSSCRNYSLNRSTTTAEDNNLAEIGFGDIQKVAEDILKEEDLDGKSNGSQVAKQLYAGCATISVSPTGASFPKTITVDFGTTNCTATDGRSRRGQLVITITDYYRNAGCVMTVQPVNYYVNDYKVEGTKTVTNDGRNAAGNLSFSVSVTNGKVTSPNGDYVEYASTRTREWIEGESTTFLTNGVSGILDDVYLITGSANGTNRDGRTFTATVTSALRVELDCRWITSGTFELMPQDLKTRTIDYGTGACDNEATVSIGNRTYTVFMN